MGDPKVIFRDSDHSYWYGEGLIEDRTRLSSVNKVWSQWLEPFDSELGVAKMAIALTNGNNKTWRLLHDFDDCRKRLTSRTAPMFKDLCRVTKLEWDYANVYGSKFHDEVEFEACAVGEYANPFTGEMFKVINFEKEYDNQSVVNDLFELKDGCYFELVVWDPVARVCGQIDIIYIWTEDGIRYFSVIDNKGLALDTPIATPSGWKLMENISVGDSIFDGNGEVTKVKLISDIHYNPCFELKFDNGDTLVADHEHRWVVSIIKSKMVKGATSTYIEEVEMTTEDIFERRSNGGVIRIKVTDVKFEEKRLPIDPYILGLWLADGNRNHPTITCVNQDIWNEIDKRGYKTSVNHNRNFVDKAESRTLYNLAPQLRELNLIKNKHIPMLYMRSSISQRLDLLRGYMDGDGCFNRVRNRCTMNTTNKQQAEDVKRLANSLGMKTTIIPYKASGFGKTDIQAYAINFTPNINPFLCRNTDYIEVMGDRINKNTSERNFYYIKDIKKVDTVPTKCLSVESGDETYLAGYSMIKTHNTNGGAHPVKGAKKREEIRKPKKTSIGKGKYKMGTGPISHLYDCTYTKYQGQVSMYAHLMEKAGYVCQDLGVAHYLDYDKNKEMIIKYPYLQKEAKKVVDMEALKYSNL